MHNDDRAAAMTNSSSTRPPHRQNPSPSPAPSSTSLQRGVDHSQMNHIGPPRAPSSRLAPVQRTGSTMSVPEYGRRRRHHRRFEAPEDDRRSLQWGDEGAGDAGWNDADGSAPASAEVPAEGAEAKSDQPRLEPRPSLRLRRHFDCPDLVIINRNPSAEDFATACTPRAEPQPAPHMSAHRPLPPPPPAASSSSSSSSGSGSGSAPRLRRRLTLPGIIKYETPPPDPAACHRSRSSPGRTPTEPLPIEYLPVATAADVQPSTAPPVDAGFGVRGGRPAAEMYVVENCARKRLQEERVGEGEVAAAADGQQTEAVATILDTPSLDGLDPPKPLTMRYR